MIRMLNENDRAFKEWAVICDALSEGRQIALLRKGGIREEEGLFRVSDPEFFLLSTYEHEDAGLLKPEYRDMFKSTGDPNPGRIGSMRMPLSTRSPSRTVKRKSTGLTTSCRGTTDMS